MKLKWADQALADVRNIDRWLTLNVDPLVAEQALGRINQQAHSLLQYPRRKPRIGQGRHYSTVDHTSYLLIYSVGGGIVTIMRVRHDKEDWH